MNRYRLIGEVYIYIEYQYSSIGVKHNSLYFLSLSHLFNDN